MTSALRLLVLPLDAAAHTGVSTAPVADRRKVRLAIAAVRAKVRHDSGGRLLVIELPDAAQPALLKLLPGATVVPLELEPMRHIGDLTPGESLFLEALRIRRSTAYREAKARRKFGDSPEERLLRKGSCVKGY